MKQFLLAIIALFIISCQPENNSTDLNKSIPTQEKEAPHFIQKLLSKYNIDTPSTQVILSWNDELSSITGNLVGYEKINGEWQVTFDTIGVNFGKNGFAPFNEKIEGDGKSPTGIFSIGTAFGYYDDIENDIDFLSINQNHFWDSNPDSPTYNQLIFEKPNHRLYEVMNRKDDLYSYGFVIEYNTKKPIPNKGSAIFAHVQRRAGSPTLGCISMDSKNIISLIGWLKKDSQPMIVMGNWNELKN